VTNIVPRLTAAEVRAAARAGYLVAPGHGRSIFGSMFSWFPSMRFGRATFWNVGGTSKPPVNAAEAATGQIVTPATALTLSAAWACVWLTARTMASLPLDLKRYSVDGKSKLEVGDPLYDVLRWKPNQRSTAFNFWTAMWASVLLWGSGYARKRMNGGKVIALEFLLPEFMTVYLDDTTKRIRFRYDDPRDPQDFSVDEIFHLFERTLDGVTGCSVIEFARNSFGLAQSGEIAASKTFKKGLNASGFINVDKFLKADQRTQFRDSIDEFTGDGPKAGGTMVLEGGTSYTQLSMKPQDAELLASRQFSVEDVCRWFNVPPILIGHSAQGQTMWGSGIEQIFAGWTRLSLRPYVTACTQAIRSNLIPSEERAELYAEYDLDDLLAADSQARATLYSSLVQNGINTRNEVRDREGLSRVEGGDTLTVQSNLVPLDQLGKVSDGGGGRNSSKTAQCSARVACHRSRAREELRGPEIMNRRTRSVPFHVKEVKASGEFSGYASVFDKLDWYGDVVRRGAFTDSIADWKAKGKLPPILWQHKSDQPIGPHLDMYEDDKGLFVRGQLLIDEDDANPEARKAYGLLRNNVISGMSIGFDIPDGGMEYDGKTNVWNLIKLDLWENSLVTFPANEDAQVTEVKNILAAGRLPAPSEFERFLRDAGGFSRKQATHIAACGYTSLRDAGLPLRDAEDEKGAIDLSELHHYFKRYGT
jgi:HK97 family phage portal protein/HK97 family phage prohead protease